MNKRKLTKIILFSLLLVGLIVAGFMIFPTKVSRRILVVQSYASDFPVYPENNNKIKAEFLKNGISPDIRTVYLDCERYSAKPEIKRMNRLIAQSLSGGWRPDIILVVNDQATYSLLKCGHPLIKKVPIVFAGVEFPNYNLMRTFSNVTGFVDNVDVIHNLEFVKRLMGNDVAIYTPMDDSFLGTKMKEYLDVQLKGRHVVGNFTTPELKSYQVRQMNEKYGYTIYDYFWAVNYYKRENEVNRLIPQIRIFNGNFNNDQKRGERFWLANLRMDGVAHIVYKCDKFTDLLLIMSPNPIFTAMNKEFGSSDVVVGGYMTTMYMEIDDQVNAASRILRGVSVKNVPITQSSKMYIVNWNAIKRFNINPGRLPKTCIIANQPFRERYPLTWIISITASIIVLLLLVSLYIYELRKRRAMNVLIRHQHNMLKSSLYAAKAFAWEYKDGLFTIDDMFWSYIHKKPHVVTLEELSDIIMPAQRHLLNEVWENIHKEESGIMQIQMSFDGRKYSWWESRYFVSEKEKNELYGMCFNIDHTKQHERELESLRRLAEKAEMKHSFLENINHEIRTPLNAITGFSHILASDENLSADEKKAYLEYVDTNNKKLLQIIDNILLVSQLESGELRMKMEEITICTLLDDIINSFKPTMKKNVKLIKDGDGDCPYAIFVDRKYITLAIRHLIENALKFTEMGYVKVGYKCDTITKSVQIFVEDTGCGISADEQKLIFNQFYKQDSFGEGTGLGLNISRLIVERFNGYMQVDSVPGKGTSVFLKFPTSNFPEA